MPASSIAQLVPVLQTAIGPAILISGIGLLLLTMTNRLGRAIDRARLLADKLSTATGAHRDKLAAQLRVIWWRAKLIRLAITLASASALLAVLLMIALFVTAWLAVEFTLLIVLLFVLCVTGLGASLVVFIHDINRSLAALHVELEDIL